MFAIITPESKNLYGLLKLRFESLRPETFVDLIDKERSDFGYICVSQFPSVTMRISKTSKAMADWWKSEGGAETGIAKCPYPYIIETASELVASQEQPYNSQELVGDEIGGRDIEDFAIEVQDYIDAVGKRLQTKGI